MPGFLLTAGAQIICAHGGQVKPVPPVPPRVKAMGQPVVVQPLPQLVTGCSNQAPPGPCLTASAITAATRVKIMGQPVLLIDSQALTTPPGTPVTVLNSQPKVKGM